VTDAKTARLTHLLGGPAAFVLITALPLPNVPFEIRASLGLLVWMSWWWITEPVHLAVTGFLPLAVLAVTNFLPVTEILPAYSAELVILLIGANMLAALWSRWGIDRRIALASLLAIGADTRQQILAWFLIAAALSAFLPNAVVAAAMMPIVIAMLRYIGIEAIGKSAFGSALLIAVAWGSSVGGAATPLGGAHNLLAVQFLEQQLLGREFLFTTWVTRVLPLAALGLLVSFVFMRFAFKPEIARVEGTRDYFKRQLADLGALSRTEKWGLALFAAAALLAFSRALYAELLPGLTPAFAFLLFGLLGFALRHRGEPLLTWEYAQPRMVWGLIYLFAGGSALGEILSRTGTAAFLADHLLALAGGNSLLAIVVFAFVALTLTQITSNTAAVAITVPITISTFQSLGVNPIPMVYIVAAAGNFGLMLPSSSAGPAIAAGYGIDLKQMFAAGFKLTVLLFVALVVGGYLLMTLWPGFGVA
jgi:sodium-dependent dicarboxylate transporter 2/3/5